MVDAIEVTDKNFSDKVLKAPKGQIVIVDFWAAWCGPCKMLGPIMEKMAGKYKGKLTVAKVNVEENKEFAEKYEISGIPAVKMFKNGKIIDEFVGYIPENLVVEWIEKNLIK
ncbi:MAG: thioredoxin [archaeon]